MPFLLAPVRSARSVAARSVCECSDFYFLIFFGWGRKNVQRDGVSRSIRATLRIKKKCIKLQHYSCKFENKVVNLRERKSSFL